MTTKDYLEKVLESQTLAEGSHELKDLNTRGREVKDLLAKAYPKSKPRIRYGGSKAKGTMILKSYDLDITCYFGHEDTEAGETLREIYDSVRDVLAAEYLVQPKPSALRLQGKHGDTVGVDFHVDVVPGRFIDGKEGDVFIFQSGLEKERLQTNMDIHIACIRDSDVVGALRLLKFWRELNGIALKTFILDLLGVDLLTNHKKSSLEKQLHHLWTSFRDKSDELRVEDPANSNNDLMPVLRLARPQLKLVAKSTLDLIDKQGWEAVFGEIPDDDDPEEKSNSLHAAAAAVRTPTRPWSP